MLNEESKEKDNKELKENIAKWYNSSAYHKLSNRLQQTDFFKILGVSRKELQHSKFIAWLLNPNETHDLGEFPLRKFLQLLAISRNEDVNLSSEFPENLENRFILGNYDFDKNLTITVNNEQKIPNGRLDIFIENLSIIGNEKKLSIIIENKINSDENDLQTKRYYEEIKKQNDIIPMFVFLYPNSLNTKCECDKFIKITYQDLVDKVIEPCLLRTHSDISKFYISEYLKTLSYSSEDLKGQLVMAISKEEKELCEKFFEENRELLTYVTKVLSLSNYDDDDFEKLSDTIADTVNKNSSSRDLTKYSFNDDGNKYGKGRLALKIFRETSKQCNTLDELKKIFQEVFKLHSVKEINIINNDMSNSTWAPEYYERRFFTKIDEQIKLGNETYYFTTQWGKDAAFDKLLEIARNTLKFDIKEIK